MQRFGGGRDATILDQRVGALEADECNRDGTMLGHSAAAEDVRANRRRQAAHQCLGRHGRRFGQLQRSRFARRLFLQQQSRPFGRANAFGRHERGGFRADEDLAAAGFALQGGETAPRRSDGQELDVGRTDGEKMELSGVHTLRHLQRDLCAGQLDPADVLQHAAHQHRRATRALGVILAVEPQEQRVAAELEQAALVLISDRQDRLEAAADHIGDLFRALASLARELLGELGEAGDVDERRGALCDPALAVRIIGQVLLDGPRNVRPHPFGVERQHRRCGFARCHRGGAVVHSGSVIIIAGARFVAQRCMITPPQTGAPPAGP